MLLDKSSRNKLNSNINTINLSNIFKSNDSKIKLDTTKQSSRRTRVLSGKSNSSNSFYRLNKSARKENKRIFQFGSGDNIKNQYSIINIKVDNFQKKEQKLKKKTLKEITTQRLMKKSKTIEFDKNIKSSKNNISEVKPRFFDFYPPFISYNKNKGKKIEFKNDLFESKDECKNSELNLQQNCSIKYSFLDDAMNNIFHRVNFVDYENKEELLQNVLIDSKNANNIKFEDFKTIGYELSPEILNLIYQDEKQRLFKIKYEELKRKYMEENSEKIKSHKILREKSKKNYIPEYKQKFENENWKNKHYESIYKFDSIKYPLTKKKIKRNFVINYPKKYYFFNNKKTKAFERRIKEPPIKRKSNSFKIDVIQNKEIKAVLKNNMKNNYINKSIENKNKTDSISSQEKITPQLKNNIKKKHNVINGERYRDILGLNKIINLKRKDYNSINRIVKVENIFIERVIKYKNEKLDTSEYINEINSKKNCQKKNTFYNSKENNNISSSKKKVKKSLSNSSLPLKNKQKYFTHKNSLENPVLRLLSFESDRSDSFNSIEESRSIINNNEQNEKKENKENKENIIDEIKTPISKEEKKENIIIQMKEAKYNYKIESINQIKKKPNYEFNDEYNKKNILEKIDNENKLRREIKKIFTPFYQIQKAKNEDYNKIEINFFCSRINKKLIIIFILHSFIIKL